MADDGKDKSGGKRPQRFGRYEIVAHIASGGMGTVYKARDVEDDHIVALKVMSPALAAKRNMTTRFRREARSASKLSHENIVAVHEFGEANGTFYLALEFVDGKDLHDYVAKSPGGRLGPEEARQFALQAARALEHIHQAGVIHRDVKPSNFLVVPRPGGALIKLTDLGLARHEDDDEHRVTKIGTTLGTVDYMAPEQARDSTSADIRSDMYSLGCTLFHMLTGRPPFAKGTMAEKIVQHMEAEPPDVCRVNAAAPPALGLIVKKLLAKKPRDRYQTPSELIQDLEEPDRVRLVDDPPPEKKQRERGLEPVKRPPEIPKPGPAKVETSKPEPKKPANFDAAIRKKRKKSQETSWAPFAIGGGVLAAALAIVLIAVNWRRTPPVEKKPEPIIAAPKVEPIVATPPPKLLAGPPPPPLKRLYQPVLALEPAALAKEFTGPFAAFPQPPADAKVIVVCRLPSPSISSVATLAEALAQTVEGGTTIIEIRDQGPHFVSALPPLQRRHLYVRGGAGIRPLLAWNGTGGPEWLALTQGILTIDGLDVVAHRPPDNACLFQVQGGDFQARDCTFSVAKGGKSGTTVVRLRGPQAEGADPKVRFTRCFVRGADVTLLATVETAADILVDGTLVVGGGQPLLHHSNREDDNLTVRLVRSTLTGHGPLWRWRSAASQDAAPRLKIMVWDTILARSEVGAEESAMLHVPDGARLELMSVKSINSLYAGWRHLLGAGGKSFDSLDAWRNAWGYREGDLALGDTWPPRPLGALDEVAAASLLPYETPAAFAAADGGPLGCDLARLPPEPPAWKQRTFERFLVAHANLPDADVPEISSGADGLYHGETIELGKIDLGQHVQVKLQTQRPAPRIVLHLTGKGTHVTSPLRFRGVEHVVIQFEQPQMLSDKKIEPLALEVKPGSPAAALIDVDGGALEIHHGRFRFENSKFANLPSHLLRVRGGDLRLDRCTLIGPLSKAPDSFQSLISCEGAGAGAAQPNNVVLRECVLQCGKTLLDLKNPGIRVRCRGSLLYALGDVINFDIGVLDTSRPDIAAQFESNTFAFRQAFINVRHLEGPPNCQPIVVQASANYFLDPAAEEPRRACLARVPADALARGLFLWQGQSNVFARDRLQAYFAGADGPVVKQPFAAWPNLLGPVGETAPLHLDAVAGKGFNLDHPAAERFALPPALRREPLPGADLVRLGLVKKK